MGVGEVGIGDQAQSRLVEVRREQQAGQGWPLESVPAFQTIKALALPFELHPAWQDSWYP